jgi:hypothetical protein
MKKRILVPAMLWFLGLLTIAQNQTNPRHFESSANRTFTTEEKTQLFLIARNSIHSMLFENKILKIEQSALLPKLRHKMGAFVTLNVDGKLRGCIGRFISDDPLWEVVSQMAMAAATEDSRFSPVSKDEFNKLRIEISVLGPLKKIKDTSEIVIGKHGIYIEKGFSSGTMLPQVASGNHWTREQFLGYTSRDKAGLGWDGWKDADIYIYDAVILEEPKK